MLGFGDIVRRSAHDFSGNVCVVHGERSQTYAEMYARACRLANALAGLGLAPGDRVALLSPNGLETVEQTAGIGLGGFVRVGLYAHQTGEVNGDLLDMVGARVLLVDADLFPPIADHLGPVEHVVVHGGAAPDGTHAYEDLLAGAAAEDPHVDEDPDAPRVIRFSAGTTGRPKGIVHSVRRWLAMGDEYAWVTPQIDERDTYLAAGPLTHAAVIFLWPFLRVGGRVVVMEAFDAGEALRLIEEERVTFTLMVPTMIQALVAHPDAPRRDLSSLRCLNYAASPISEATMTKAVDLLGDVLYQMYGQSEAVPITMLLPHQHRPRGTERERRWMRSVGRATPNSRITIVDEDGRPVAPGEVGEIAVDTPARMSGIWGDAEATAARMLPDGSVLTRDMGFMDEDGFLYLADRKDDMIISGGHNIWPAELENAIASHPAVAEACVVGVPHERWGETPVAVVVPVAGATIEAAEIIEITRERCGSVKKVTAVEFVDALPKSGVGKILRREVRERFWAGREERVAGA